MKNKKVLVHLHLYYHDQIDFMIKKLNNINNCDWDLYVTFNTENLSSNKKLLKLKPDVHLIKVDNTGYDVWPFIQIMKLVNLNDYSYILKIHTKNKSSMKYIKDYKATGYWWRDQLINSLIGSKNKFKKNLNILDNNPAIGMLCSEVFLFETEDQLPEDTYMLDNELKLLNFKTKSRKFCAGTMFMARAEIYNFLKQDIINKLRFEPSEGSSSNTSLAHTYERILSLAVDEFGFNIYPVKNYKLYFKLQLKQILETIFSIKNTKFYSGRQKDITILGKKFIYCLHNSKSEKIKYLEYILNNNLSPKSEYYKDLSDTKIDTKNINTKIIAFYLPQFHTFKENEEWHGRGFTEWTNVTKAIPQYTGHHQPQLPIDVGFYDLSTDKVMYRQIELAKQYGISGFCFHYYWFSGKRLMEKPIFNYLNNKELDLPFCLCWANENWSKKWDGGNTDLLMEQKLIEGDDEKFFYDILPFFKDERYIKIDNKPVLIIYRPHIFHINRFEKFVKILRKLTKENGFNDLYLVNAKTFGYCWKPEKYFMDAMVEFPPHNIQYKKRKLNCFINKNFVGKIHNLSAYINNKEFIYDADDYRLFKTVFPSWDNTARRGYIEANILSIEPYEYKKWLSECIKWTKQNNPENEQFVFVNAWNEWAEGAHLEPDQRYGYAYLQATREALEETT